MEPSDEIKDAMVEVLDAYGSGEEPAWRRIWSIRPGVISLGTDPREWWDGGETAIALHTRHLSERGPAVFTAKKIAAFQEGSVGWAVADTTVDWKGGHHAARVTGVFHLERGRWKLVHLHRSFGILNEDVGAADLTTNLESIAESVSDERTDLSHAAAPNGTVTVLFTDIEGSTQLLERLGDRAWMDVLHDHNRAVRAQSALHNGFEVKSQGDSFMLAFASARDALRTAVGIQRDLACREDAVRVRIGMHTAEAIREADDFYGKGVVLAARVAAEARGAEILVSSLVRDLLDATDEFFFEDPVEVELKGLSGFHRLHAVRWREAPV